VAKNKHFICPLCESSIGRDKYLEIVGVWEERKKLEASLNKEMVKIREERLRLNEDRRTMKREIKLAANEAATKATKKEKKRADRLSTMIQGKAEQIQFLSETVKELREQLKRGTTPQIEGFNFERALVKDLRKHFPDDIVEHPGKSGDILLCVYHKGKQIGCLLFECKLTSSFSGAYIFQTKKAIGERNASYGILVTLASKKGTAGFWADDNVMVVHPFGAVHVAGVLRQIVLDLHSARISNQESSRRATVLIKYISSDEFKNLVSDTIFRTLELYGMLKKEVTSHNKLWKRRFDHYRQTHANSSGIKTQTSGILHGSTAKRYLKAEPKLLPLTSLSNRTAA
jgi:hypothetical protein